jgi:4'-phosphopantetheinyl transferase
MSLIANSKYDKLSTFYEIWGCKESYIKAIGVGLALELDQLNFRNENDMVTILYNCII